LLKATKTKFLAQPQANGKSIAQKKRMIDGYSPHREEDVTLTQSQLSIHVDPVQTNR
jgi:hypothetical protein